MREAIDRLKFWNVAGQPALALFIAVNLALAVAGLLLPFAAVQADSAAPWATEMQRVAWAISGPSFVAILAGAGARVYYFIRGRPEFLFAVSIVALWLPFAVVAGYLWYLFNLEYATISGGHGHATIGGPVGFWMVFISGALLAMGLGQAVIALGVAVIRFRRNQHSALATSQL